MRFAYTLILAGCLTAPVAAQPPIVDGDADGVSDEIDLCPYSEPRAPVGVNGCVGPPDADIDGIPDAIDDCPDTPADAVVDPFGCPPPAADCGAGCADDYDGDGISDAADACPYSQPGSVVAADGCALDSDLDGIPDGVDRCPNTPLRQTPNDDGCAGSQSPGSAARPAPSAVRLPEPNVVQPPVRSPRRVTTEPSAVQLIRQPERTVRRLLARLQLRTLRSGLRAPGTGLAVAGGLLDSVPSQALSDAVPVSAAPERELTHRAAAAEPAPPTELAVAPRTETPVLRRSPQTRATPLPIPQPVTPTTDDSVAVIPVADAAANTPAARDPRLPPTTAQPEPEPEPLAPVTETGRPPVVAELPRAPLRLVPVTDSVVAIAGLRIAFVRGSSELDGRIMASLRDALPGWRRNLLAEPAAQLQIRADAGGNAALADTRARIVRAFLMAMGLPGAQVVVDTGAYGGTGELELLLSSR